MVDGRSYDTSADIWCLGILLYEFLTGGPPFVADGEVATYRRILRSDLHFPASVTPGARDLISRWEIGDETLMKLLTSCLSRFIFLPLVSPICYFLLSISTYPHAQTAGT